MNIEQKREYARKYSKKYRQEHKEEVAKYRKQYQQTHRGKIKGYYIKNRERLKQYYQENKETITKQQREYDRKRRQELPWTTHHMQAKQRCDNPNVKCYKYYGGKGIKFLLTMDEVKTLYERDNAKDMKRPSIDRIYNDGNYIFGNCRFIELAENARRRYC